MRLIHFTASDVWRGHEQKIIYLYEEFRDKGYVEAQWIICPLESEIYRVATEKKLNVIPFDYKSEYDFKFAKELKRIVVANKVDLIFIHSSKAQTLAVVADLVYRLKIPLVLCRTMIKKIHTNALRKWKYNYSGIKKIICISQPVVDVLKPAIKDHSRLCIVGAVTDLARFSKKEKNGMLHKEFNIPSDYKIVGNIGAFVGVKDHFTLVNAVEILVKKGIKAKYIFVGIGDLEQEIKDLVSEKGLQDDIIFAGFRKDVPEILPEFDLFLFTSKNEAVGSVILEAYACKVPVVAANAGGVPEVVINNETGFLAEAGNAADFAEKAAAILGDEALQKKFAANGYKFLIENFTKDIIAKKMFDELNAVLLAYKK